MRPESGPHRLHHMGNLAKRLLTALAGAFALAACSATGSDTAGVPAVSGPAELARPNILLIVVDDMGFSDLGSFGGEIATPNLDELAYNGIRFTNFHASMMCSPSRAMLLTGVDSHLTGLGNMLEELSPNQKGQPGYEGHLNERVVTMATLLRDAGYGTYVTGKWHLGSGEGQGPSYRGFDRSFVLESGGASHFADMRPAYAPSPEIKASYSSDGRRLSELPSEFRYSTQYYADQMIDYLRQHDRDEPFFAYLAYTAPHWPLQAPDEAIERQVGRYDEGYDVLAEQRLSRLKDMGLVPADATRGRRSPKERPWDALSDGERATELRAMEVYAAMIDEIDRHTGRLIAYLGEDGFLENTLIVFLSDNGPEGHDLDETWPRDMFPDIRNTIDESHDFSYASMGRPGSYTLYGPNWANAGSPAFSLHKAFPYEGGTRVTAFVHHPGLIESPRVSDDFVYVTDVMPTLLELAGVEHPGSVYANRPVEAMSGRSFVNLLNGESSEDGTRVTALELIGKRAVRRGNWKLVHVPEPWGVGDWQLFDIESDLAELNDVSADHPEIVAELVAAWGQYAEENGVILPDWVSGY